MKYRLIITAAALLLAGPSLADMPEPAGRVLVTVGGDLPEGNNAAPDPTKLGFFRYLELEYRNAVAFDDAMLTSLPQSQIVTAPYGDDTWGTYSGPSLRNVMKFVIAEGKTALPMALDGYQVVISWDTIERYEPILATHYEGVPIPLGQLGPALIVFPPVDDAKLAEELEALSGYAVVFIGVE